jgi:cytochrome c oxidase assembly protein subunit 15
MLVTLVLLGLAWQLKVVGMTRLAGLVLIALAAQITLGISNVLFHLPLPVAVAHNAGGAALLLTMVLVNYHARTSLVRVKQPVLARWRLSPRKHSAAPITIKGETPWRF